jgi:hypothetical protein
MGFPESWKSYPLFIPRGPGLPQSGEEEAYSHLCITMWINLPGKGPNFSVNSRKKDPSFV